MPYIQKSRLGAGFFGEVWLEEDVALSRNCAAKYLNSGFIQGNSPFDEARIMLGAVHENVVQVYSADLEHGVPVIRMEYLPAGSVADRYQGKPSPVAECLHIIEDACRGVEALHARGILHRDIKPANLLMGQDGHAKVSDFGLACTFADLASAAAVGYVEHLPPEAVKASGAIESVAGDIYALGVTLYRLLNGDSMMRAPVRNGNLDVPALIVAGKYPDRTNWQHYIDGKLQRVCKKAMSVDPTKRFRSAAEFRNALEGATPMVSWQPVIASGPDLSWLGEMRSGGPRFRADLVDDGHGNCSFEIKRSRVGKRFRAMRSDDFKGSRKDGLAHASTVLVRVSAQGRLSHRI